MAEIEKAENVAGLDGIEFVEFSAPDPKVLEDVFKKFGFVKIGKHKTKNVDLYRQGNVNFILNQQPGTFAYEFAQKHGPGICAMGFRCKDVAHAMNYTTGKGGRPLEDDLGSHSFSGIYGIGDSAVYFVDNYKDMAVFKDDFEYIASVEQPGFKVELIDHLTNNVPEGEMQKWCDFYSNLFNFREVRFFDIKGQQTGLVSKVMRSPCGKITIPINEPTEAKSQIQEYLDEYNGSGIQHLAFLTPDIEFSVGHFRESGIQFLDVPDTYYEAIPERLPCVEEDLSNLQDLRILVDGDDNGYLLQIFSQNQVGPIFFETIQRKGHDGFGEGNFQALFDAIERDQKRRGYL